MLLMTETCPKCGAELNVDNAAGGLCGRCLFERGIEFTSTLAVNLADGSTPGSPRFTAPDPVEVEADLLSFDVLELVGQGGMGAVYKAYQRNLDRTVAIKILPRQSAGGHEFAERFAREARALARLRHENIVMAYDYGLTDRYLYSVMEYVGGPNLREMLRGREAAASKLLSPTGRGWEKGDSIEPSSDVDASPARPLPSAHPHGEGVRALAPQRALEIARDICAALQYAHDHGVVHRDIKPENVLLDESGRVKIADFGLAKLLQPDPRELALTHTRHFMGTLHYMAPEQCERPHETDHRADIYSLGVVLYEMLTGELPIGRFDPPSMRADVDPRIDEVVLRALEKDPARRYAAAAEFGDTIGRELSVAAGLVPVADNSSPLRGEAERGVKPQAAKSFSAFDLGRFRRGPLVAAGFFAFLVLAWFGWQLLIKYQRDKDGNSSFTLEVSGGTDNAKRDGARQRLDIFLPITDRQARAKPASEPVSDQLPLELFGARQRHPEPEFFGVNYRAASTRIDANRFYLFVIQGAKFGRMQFPIRGSEFGQFGTLAADARRNFDSLRDNEPLELFVEQVNERNTVVGRASNIVTYEWDEMRTPSNSSAAQQMPANDKSRRKTAGAGDAAGVDRLGPVQIELLDGGQLTLRGDPRDVERVERWINELETGATSKEGKRPEDLIRRLRGSAADTDGQPKSSDPDGVFQVFKLKSARARDTSDLLQKIFDQRTNRFEVDDQTNSIVAMADRDAMSTITELLAILDYPDELLPHEINPQDDPRLIKLREKIRDVEGLYERARSVAKYPTDPAVSRYAARLKILIEAEDQFIAGLREAARLKLPSRSGPSARRTKGTMGGTQASPGGQTDNKHDRAKDQIKIFTLRNSRAAEANEMLRKLYPNSDALRITVDARTNSLIVEGDREMLDEIEAILLRLDESSSAKSDTGPTKIQRSHKLRISVAGAHAQAPINDLYNIDLDGYVNLGAEYGKVKVIGLTADQAQTAILNKLRAILREPKVVLSIEAASSPTERLGTSKDRRSSAPVRIQAEAHALRISAAGVLTDAPIDGVYHPDLDGYVNLGAEYGKIKVAGLTADEAEKAVLTQLRQVLRDPKVTLTIEGLHQAAARPPIRITAQIHGGDRMLRVPFAIEGKLAEGRARYTLVAKGPRIGRLEFDVTPAMGLSGYGAGPAAGSGEGLVTSSKGLSIPSGESIEVFIEEKPSTPQARPVRVSNIVNLTWDVADADAQKATKSRSELRKLHEQLKFVEEQLNSQIPNARDTLETKLLKRERDELQRQIIGLGRLIERVPQPAASDPLANHPELAQMRRRLGELNAKISQERFRQEGAKESAYLRALKNQSQRLQNDIWEREKALRPDQSHAAESPAEPQGE